MNASLRRFGFVLAIAALLLGAGCATQGKVREAELAQLASLLPGRYDNRAQAEGAGGRAALALELHVERVYAPFLSEHVFYVQENVLDDPRRVISQRLFVLAVDAEGRIVQRTLAFAEPARWRNGHRNTDLFKGMLPGDVGVVPGACALEWQSATGTYTALPVLPAAAAAASTCSDPSRVEFDGGRLALGDPLREFRRRR